MRDTAGSQKTGMFNADIDGVRAAVDCLASGGLAAFPTETVYGLGADATNADAIARLYQAKGRPSFNPLIAHVADLNDAARIAHLSDQAVALAHAFWPGPLTIVARAQPKNGIADLATAGLDTIALRVPAHPVANQILRALGKPVVAPSANRSGHVSPTTAIHVAEDLGNTIDVIVDGGAVELGLESTIIACIDQPMLLRPGSLPRGEIERVLGRLLRLPPTEAMSDNAAPLAPGMLASHYAPRTPLRLDATTLEDGEALLAFGRIGTARKPVAMLNLSANGDPREAAANLFGHLRELDKRGAKRIAVMPIPSHDLGEAINDRLRRAAVPQR